MAIGSMVGRSSIDGRSIFSHIGISMTVSLNMVCHVLDWALWKQVRRQTILCASCREVSKSGVVADLHCTLQLC